MTRSAHLPSFRAKKSFSSIDYLKSAGIHQSDKSGKIDFDSVTPWPGRWIGAEGRFQVSWTPKMGQLAKVEPCP